MHHGFFFALTTWLTAEMFQLCAQSGSPGSSCNYSICPGLGIFQHSSRIVIFFYGYSFYRCFQPESVTSGRKNDE